MADRFIPKRCVIGSSNKLPVGKAAASSRNLMKQDGEWRVLPAKVTLEIGKDTVIRHEQAGGGGWGDPASRDRDSIGTDLANGKISPARAMADYRFEAEPRTDGKDTSP